MSEQPARQLVRGVFSQTRASQIGTGTTIQKSEVTVYYYAKERADGVIEVQTLGPDNKPFGETREFNLDGFLKTFTVEPQMSLTFSKAEAACQAEIQKAVARGDKFHKQGKTFSAEFEYSKALVLDEESVRANFGIGLCYIERGETDKAREVLGRLVRLEAAFQDEHKHLFNEFGISLRKNKMDAEALAYYSRAVELCPKDENLHYNMARASYDMGDIQAASLRLAYCLTLNPEHAEARKFLDFINRKNSAGG